MSATHARAYVAEISPIDDETRMSFERIWETVGRGDPRITIAMLDGPVDLTHGSLRRANIRVIGQRHHAQSRGAAVRHGTAVASIVFGTGEPHGLASGCTGLSIELFNEPERGDGSQPNCSQAELAAAIDVAVDAGAIVINISAGELALDTSVHPRLLSAIEKAKASNALIIAATGDGGCCNRRIPSSLASVVAVSDLTHRIAGVTCYPENCVSVPGTNINVADPGGRLRTATGSSYAAAVVSALAGLLLSEQLRSMGRTDPAVVRDLICNRSFGPGATTALDVAAIWNRVVDSAAPRHAGTGANSPKFAYTINDWALRTKFRGLDPKKFGSVDVLLPTGGVRNESDLRYPIGAESKTIRIVPASDEAMVDFPDGTRGAGHSKLDNFLRQEMNLSRDDPIYALLSYIHPEEHHLSTAQLTQSAKLYLGHRHVGAYLGNGRTTHALSAPSRWRGSAPSSMALNFDRHPANVQTIALTGVPQATLNRNATLIDLVVSAKAKVPLSTETIDCRTVDLTTTLQYYRDLLLNRSYLEDVSWFTNCSVHKSIVVNLAFNVPHNERAILELFGAPDGESLWKAITKTYAETTGRTFGTSDETDFTPLWRLQGIPVSQVRPLTFREYNRYHAAVTEHRQTTFIERRPLALNEGLAWPLETLFDILCAFVDTYTPMFETGGLVAAAQAIVLRHVVRHRLDIDDTRFLNVAEPVIAALLAAESLRSHEHATENEDDWWALATAQLTKWTMSGDDPLYEPVRDAFMARYLDNVVQSARSLISPLPAPRPRDDTEVARWYRECARPALDKARHAFVNSGGGYGLCSSPAIFHKLGRGEHPINERVSIRTVCTAMDVSHLTAPSPRSEVSPVVSEPSSDGALTGVTAYEAKLASGEVHRESAIAPATSWSSGDSVTTHLSHIGAPSPYSDNPGVRLSATSNQPTAGHFVYALGKVTYDFPTRGRRESMLQLMGDYANPEDTASMVAHLDSHPTDAAALQWILELEGVPLYFLYPTGPFAKDTFATLREFLREQVEEGVERISIPGTIVGTAPHRIGVELPVVAPEIRGMFSWTTEALVASLVSVDADQKNSGEAAERRLNDVRAGVAAFLDRVYFDLRNPGVSDRERALNYAATNAFSIERIYEQAIKEQMEIDTIDVEPTSIGIPGLSMWDVKLSFFFPDRPPQSPRRLFRFTISVEDVMPITIGPVRSWMVR